MCLCHVELHRAGDYSEIDDEMRPPWIVAHTFGLDMWVFKDGQCTDGIYRVTQLAWHPALWVRAMSLFLLRWHRNSYEICHVLVSYGFTQISRLFCWRYAFSLDPVLNVLT